MLLIARYQYSRKNSDTMDNATALKFGRNVLYIVTEILSEGFFDISENVHFLDLRVQKHALFNHFS